MSRETSSAMRVNAHVPANHATAIAARVVPASAAVVRGYEAAIASITGLKSTCGTSADCARTATRSAATSRRSALTSACNASSCATAGGGGGATAVLGCTTTVCAGAPGAAAASEGACSPSRPPAEAARSSAAFTGRPPGLGGASATSGPELHVPCGAAMRPALSPPRWTTVVPTRVVGSAVVTPCGAAASSGGHRAGTHPTWRSCAAALQMQPPRPVRYRPGPCRAGSCVLTWCGASGARRGHTWAQHGLQLTPPAQQRSAAGPQP